MRRIPITAIAVTLLLGVGACSSAGPSAGPGGGTARPAKPRINIDPRHYFDDYPEVDYEDSSSGPGGVPLPSAAPPAGKQAGESGRPPVVGPQPPGLDEDNAFDPSGHHPFVETTKDFRSTFGLDVDTGSYSIGRKFLSEGQLPPPDSVRTEEWVNAFGYDYPSQSERCASYTATDPTVASYTATDPTGPADPTGQGDDASVVRPATDIRRLCDLNLTVGGAPAPLTEDGTQLLRIGLQGRSVSDADRPPANLTFVIDVSGSMDIRERLGLVKSSLALLVVNLRDTDTLSIVTYSDDASVLLEPTPVRDARRIVAAIDQLQPTNSTNMEAGLREGYAQARRSFRPDAINTVILASDGVANVGDTGKDSLPELIRKEGRKGVQLVTVGFGMGTYNDALMEALADRGDGFYSYIDTYAEAERLFTKGLTSTLTVVANDAKVQVTFDSKAVASYRLIGYENRDIADDDFDNDQVDAGELGAGHTVTALYELRLTEGSEKSLGSVAVRHRSTATDENVTTRLPILRSALARSFDEAPADLRLAATAAAFAGLLGHDPVTAERGTTLDRLASLAAGLSNDKPADRGGDRASATDLVKLIDQARNAQP